MSKPIIVTGGAGFIGRNLVHELNLRGQDNIVIVDHLDQSDKWKNLVGLQYEDYMDREEFLFQVMGRSMPPADTVFHLGACSSTTEKDSGYLAENNYRFTKTLCAWCLENQTRFITASSAATYGDGAQGYSDGDENALSLKPLNMYGYSKHMFDLWALKNKVYHKIVGLKYFNVYGPYEDHKGEMRSVAHKAFEQILETKEVKLFKSYKPEYKDGEQVRDFIYVKDAVDMTLFFYDNWDVSGLYNCGTGKARTWVDLVKAVFSAMDLEPKIRFIDMPDHLRGKYQYFTEAEMTKARNAGYQKEFTSLEEGVKEYVKHYLEC